MTTFDHLSFDEAAEAYVHHRRQAIAGLNAAGANNITSAVRDFQLAAASIHTGLAIAAAVLAAASKDAAQAAPLTFPEVQK